MGSTMAQDLCRKAENGARARCHIALNVYLQIYVII
jgi:hypothetical protein